MAVNEVFAEFVRDQLAPLGPVSVRRMFGGAGVFCDGLMFGLIARDTLYFRVDDGNKSTFAAEGMRPFSYEGKGRMIELPYWRVPERLFDEADAMLEWARAALAAARRVANKKKPGTRSKRARSSRSEGEASHRPYGRVGAVRHRRPRPRGRGLR